MSVTDFSRIFMAKLMRSMALQKSESKPSSTDGSLATLTQYWKDFYWKSWKTLGKVLYYDETDHCLCSPGMMFIPSKKK